MADPGLPVGVGGVDLRQGCFSAKMYVKMKELGPVGGRAARPLDSPMLLFRSEVISAQINLSFILAALLAVFGISANYGNIQLLLGAFLAVCLTITQHF